GSCVCRAPQSTARRSISRARIAQEARPVGFEPATRGLEVARTDYLALTRSGDRAKSGGFGHFPYRCLIPSACHFLATLATCEVIEERRLRQVIVEQVDVPAQREAGIGVTEEL